MVNENMKNDHGVGEPRRVVGYLRASGAECEREATLALQENAIRCFVDDAGDELVRLYVETGVAGAERSALARLMEDALSDDLDFDTVVVWNYYRLNRKVAELLGWIRIWSDRGVDVVSVTDEVDLSSFVRLFAKITRAQNSRRANMARNRPSESKGVLS